jgi:flagellar biosynthetic protein FliQ
MDGDGGVLSAAVEALWLALRVAGLPLMAMLAVGLVVSVLQALTQVQEPTLAFLPKLVAMALVLLLSGPAIGGSLRAYADALLGRIVAAGGMP